MGLFAGGLKLYLLMSAPHWLLLRKREAVQCAIGFNRIAVDGCWKGRRF